ncbi:hypothetical protein TSUD_216830 [Trifolium subterraneum]|uniref:Reverse transcriptase domain-containing protein n=1 Tax=Trifolium subterraneum TaxID=3900 RepID=A0A2Z6M0Y2_TRISU|nr:hypothetical protein TSUD_216830 [Trifolium subterraneum]
MADGDATEGVQPIRQAVFAHFASHFKASVVDTPEMDNLQFIRLSSLEGDSLTKPFSLEEVKSAVWDCDSYKSPGPDEINFGFIKDFWPELQADIMRFIAEFHRNGKLTKGLNSTFIALIPKILDGILIANEAMDEARRTKKELMLFKVNFEKSYDSVDWGYLEVVMGKMSFPVLWRRWIEECICTASASVLVNGSPTEEFPLERGLRQGDPLSPFLFLLAAEGLNVLMQAMVDHQLFSRVGGSGSSWWREIVRIRDGVEGLGGGRFGEGILKRVGDGTETFFWTDPWLGGIPLCERFRRLFDLAVNRSCTVVEMFSLGWDNGGEVWEWRRQLRAWRRKCWGSARLYFLTYSCRLRPPTGGYGNLIMSERLMRDWLPTKTNLAIRGIITPEAQLCVTGCGGIETTHHLFISCNLFGSLGHQLGCGLTCHRWIRKIWLIIFFSLLSLLVVIAHAAPFSSLFGSYVFG